MIEPVVYATWMGKISDRVNRALLPVTMEEYYAILSPILSTEEFERAAYQIFRDETFWPAPRMFIELGQPDRARPPQYKALGSGVSGRQTFGGGCFETDTHGQLVSHKATCHCGREYLQYCLSIPWLEAIPEGARAAMMREFPIGRCPTDCPSCSRKILSTGISHPQAPRERERPEWAA